MIIFEIHKLIFWSPGPTRVGEARPAWKIPWRQDTSMKEKNLKKKLFKFCWEFEFDFNYCFQSW